MSPNEKIYHNISAISYPQPPWRYILVFQSWSQLSSWIIIVLLTTLLMYGLLVGLKEPLPIEGLLLGVALGSLVSVVMVVPAQFRMHVTTMDSVETFYSVMDGIHYVESHRTPDFIVYRQKLPRFLRWREGEVVVRPNDGCLVIDGPRAILVRVREELIKKT